MSCVNIFPKHSIVGGQYGASVHYPLHQFRTHDIMYLWTFSKWQGTDSISTL